MWGRRGRWREPGTTERLVLAVWCLLDTDGGSACALPFLPSLPTMFGVAARSPVGQQVGIGGAIGTNLVSAESPRRSRPDVAVAGRYGISRLGDPGWGPRRMAGEVRVSRGLPATPRRQLRWRNPLSLGPPFSARGRDHRRSLPCKGIPNGTFSTGRLRTRFWVAID